MEELVEGWRGTLGAVETVEVPSARLIDIHLNWVKSEGKNQYRLRHTQQRNPFRRLPSRIWLKGLFQ